MATRNATDWIDAEAAALAMADNHRSFRDCWLGDAPDEDGWALVYTHNRDSGLLEQSNAAAIEKALDKFDEEQTFSVTHGHWAVGSLYGHYILTGSAAWATYCELMARLDDYPVLDEDDWGQREYVATVENIEGQLYRFELAETAPDSRELIATEVYYWLSQNGYDNELESHDDQGGYPNEDAIGEALAAHNWLAPDDSE